MINAKRPRRSRRSLGKCSSTTAPHNLANMLDSSLCWVSSREAQTRDLGLYQILTNTTNRNVFIMMENVLARRFYGPVSMCKKVAVKKTWQTVLWSVISGENVLKVACHCDYLHSTVPFQVFPFGAIETLNKETKETEWSYPTHDYKISTMINFSK